MVLEEGGDTAMASEEGGDTAMDSVAIACIDKVHEDFDGTGLNREAEENRGDDEEKVDYDEELIGRYECEIEEDVADFVDEECRVGHEIPESLDDEEEDEFVVRNRRMGMRSGKLDLGSSFYTKYQFKEAVLDYALSKTRNVKQNRWDKDKISYICGSGKKCKWRVYCSFDNSSKKWVIKTRFASHSCHRNGKCFMLKSPVIATLFMDSLRVQHNCMPEEIQRLIKENWKLVSSRDQCQRGRLIALDLLEKEYKEQFSHLRGYAEEILFTNLGSTAIVETIPNAAGEDMFDKFYVCLAGLKRSWGGSCRPIIGLDGTFLKDFQTSKTFKL